MRISYIVLTNNPLVYEKLNGKKETIYCEGSYEEILKEIRNKIHEGHTLLTHPLSGSVKPNETPYKSVLISKEKGALDNTSIMLIENAIQACQKFKDRTKLYKPEVYRDFQLIDWTLLESAMGSADTL